MNKITLKKLCLIIMIAVSLPGCSQKKKSDNQQPTTYNTKSMYDINQYIFPEAKDLTEANFVEKLNSKIKHYEKEPIYYYRINKQNCLIEIFNNDVKDYDDYKLENTITPIEVGHILKSGTQTITVKMYPVGDLINKDLGLENQPPATKLSEKARVDISVVMIDEKSKKGFDDEKVITTQASPKEAAGKEVYEFNFTFNAEVPYEFEGWTKGQDISKLNQDLVRKKAVEFYEMVGQIHLNKDLNAMLKLDYLFTYRIKQSFYRSEGSLKKTLNEFRDDVMGYDYTSEPIKDYHIEYMGDGKILKLVTNRLDPDLRGGGALILRYGNEGMSLPGITLYLPQGRKLEEGFMMWK